jgi:holliday junction DNA helicase RuvA
MIASLKGTLQFRGINRVVVEVQGVGYEVAVSLHSLERLPHEGDLFLHVYTAVRENALELYGFAEETEKTTFEMLLGVAGVGPRTAISVLSGISAEEFCQAVMVGDRSKLTAIPGIGKKSAERIILELKEKIKKLGMGEVSTGVEARTRPLEDDLISSLVNLGYKEKIASTTAKKILSECSPDVGLEQALKKALKKLMK